MSTKRPEKVGKVVSEALEKAGGLRPLSRAIDVAPSTISSWTNDNPTSPQARQWQKLLTYLGVEESEIDSPLVLTDNGRWTKDQEIERLQQRIVKIQREHDEKERENKKLKTAFAKLKKAIGEI
jgi:hypothetical protein